MKKKFDPDLVQSWAFVKHVPQGKGNPAVAAYLECWTKAEHYKGYNSSQFEVLNTGIYKQGGYSYDLRPFLCQFLVQEDKRSQNWHSYWACNKTALRNAAILCKDCGCVELAQKS